MCHEFLKNKCSVRDARYCELGWHVRPEDDTKLQYDENNGCYPHKGPTSEPASARGRIRLVSVYRGETLMKKARSQDRPRTPEDDTDTETETQTVISLCQLGFFKGIPELNAIENAYKKKMHEAEGNEEAKARITQAFKFVYRRLKRVNTK